MRFLKNIRQRWINLGNKHKKGQLNMVSDGAITLGIAAVVIGIMASILAGIQTSQAVNSTSFNASEFGLSSLNTFGQNLPLIATVLIGVVLLGLVVAYFSKGVGTK